MNKKNNTKKEIALILLLIASLLVVVAIIPAGNKDTKKDSIYNSHSSISTKPFGTKALYYYMKDILKDKPKRIFRNLEKINNSKLNTDVLLIISPIKAFTKKELKSLYHWVWNGKTVVFSFPDFIDYKQFADIENKTNNLQEPHSLKPFPVMLDFNSEISFDFIPKDKYKKLKIYKDIEKLAYIRHNHLIVQAHEYHVSLKELYDNKKSKDDKESNYNKFQYTYDELYDYNYMNKNEQNDIKTVNIGIPYKTKKQKYNYQSIIKYKDKNYFIYVPIGKGGIYIASNSFLFMNFSIYQNDNIEFLHNLFTIIGLDKTYTFSEFHNIRAEKNSIPELLRDSKFFPLILYGIFLLIIFYWMNFKSLSIKKTAQIIKRRAIIEHIKALSNLYLKSKKSYYLLEKNFEYFKHKLIKQFNIIQIKSNENLADYISKRSLLSYSEILRILTVINNEIKNKNHNTKLHFELIKNLNDILSKLRNT